MCLLIIVTIITIIVMACLFFIYIYIICGERGIISNKQLEIPSAPYKMANGRIARFKDREKLLHHGISIENSLLKRKPGTLLAWFSAGMNSKKTLGPIERE